MEAVRESKKENLPASILRRRCCCEEANASSFELAFFSSSSLLLLLFQSAPALGENRRRWVLGDHESRLLGGVDRRRGQDGAGGGGEEEDEEDEEEGDRGVDDRRKRRRPLPPLPPTPSRGPRLVVAWHRWARVAIRSLSLSLSLDAREKLMGIKRENRASFLLLTKFLLEKQKVGRESR